MERYFKAVDAIPLENNKYKLSDSILGKYNRYMIKSNHTPLEAAKKIFRRMCKLKNNSNMNFVLYETTNGSDKALYFYSGKVENREKNKIITFKKNSKGKTLDKPRVIEIKYNYNVEAQKGLNHPQVLRNWKG